MAKQTFHDVPDGELLEQLTQSRDEMFKLRFQHATGQLTSHARLGQVRKQIARLQTELRAREIAAAEEELASTASAAGSDKDEESR
jgi:large subunit ribosomal protein L29